MRISDWSSDVLLRSVADIVKAAAEETVRLIRAEGGNAVYSHCDVSIEDNAWSTVELALNEFGRLDGAFTNAGLLPVNVSTEERRVGSEGVRTCRSRR